jgi:hypothetical protein
VCLVIASHAGLSRGQGFFEALRTAPATNPPAAAAPAAPTPAPPAALDTRPAYMAIVTNTLLKTNVVIVTNYVVVTNLTYATNLYNAQGQLLQPVAPVPGLIPIPAAPTGPDPAVVKAGQNQAVQDLLSSGVAAASNKLCVAGGFANDPGNKIAVPEGVTVFDRKKGEALQAALNSAAEKAAPEALAIIQLAIGRLKPAEPAQVLQGGNDAATRLLATSEGQNISSQVLPIVQRASASARAPEAYQAVMLRGGGLFGAVLGGGGATVDLDAHISRGLLDAILKTLTAQENLVRTDPAARKTPALQEAFKK